MIEVTSAAHDELAKVVAEMSAEPTKAIRIYIAGYG